MITLKDLEVESLQADTLIVDTVKVDSINGITPAELNCLKGSTTNIQDQLDRLKTGSENLVKGWQ